MQRRVVVDASVGLKWLVDEPLTEDALRVLADYDVWLVPHLFWAEVVNALCRKERTGELPEGEALLKLEELSEVGVLELFDDTLPQDALVLAQALDLTAYDAFYLAIALSEGEPLATADAGLAEGAATIGVTVRWVGEAAQQ